MCLTQDYLSWCRSLLLKTSKKKGGFLRPASKRFSRRWVILELEACAAMYVSDGDLNERVTDCNYDHCS